MKKRLIIPAIAALALVACEKETVNASVEEIPAATGRIFHATAEGTTKATLSNTGTFLWETADQIRIFSNSDSKLYKAKGAGAEDDFEKVDTELSGDATWAVFPATIATEGAISGNTLTASIPSTYSIDAIVTDGETNVTVKVPLLAKASGEHGETLSFNHLGGLVRINLGQVSGGVKKFTVQTPGKNIAGSTTVDLDADKPVLAVPATGEDLVTIELTSALADNTANCAITVPLPVNDYTDFIVKMYNDNDVEVGRYEKSGTFTITRADMGIFSKFVVSATVTPDIEGDVTLPEVSNESYEAVAVDFSGKTSGTYTLKYGSTKPAIVFVTGDASTSGVTINGDLSSSTVDMLAGSYAATSLKTAASTLIIREGVTVSEVTVEQGNVKVEGKVTTIEIPATATADGSNPVEITVSGTAPTINTEANLVLTSSSESDITINASDETLNIVTNDENEEKGEITVSGIDHIKALFKNGGEYTMTEDYVVTEALVVEEDKEVVLDLNGKTISYPEDAATTITGGIIQVKRGGTLTVKDATATTKTVGDGKILGGSKAYGAIQVTVKDDNAEKTATLSINGGTIVGYYYGIVGNGSRHNTDITIKKAYVKATSGPAVFHPQEGTLTVSSTYTTLEGTDAGIEMRAGTLSVSSAVVKATSETFQEQASGSGSTITGAAVAISQHTTDKDLNVTLSSGTYSGVYAVYEKDLQNTNVDNISLTVKAGTYNGNIYSQNCTKFISGGTYSADPAEYLADNYRVKPDTEYKVEKFVVNDNVTSASEIGTSLSTSGIYTLGGDIEGKRFTSGAVSATDVTINLNGHTISYNVAGSYGTFLTKASQKLTFNGEGTVYGKYAPVWASSANSEVTINGGTFKAGGPQAIYCQVGTVYINGGTFITEDETESNLDNGQPRYLLNCLDANYKNGTAKIIVKGGYFKNFNPADCAAEGAHTNFVADGYTVYSNGEYYYVAAVDDNNIPEGYTKVESE